MTDPGPARRFDDDDVLRSLCFSAARDSRGLYMPGGGIDIHLGAGSSEREMLMISEHEAAHLQLNLTTAFGFVLRAVGSRATLRRGDHSQDVGVLRQLIDQCRRTHEVIATTAGVWLSHIDATDPLAKYPAYRQYLAIGRVLAGSLPEQSSAAKACLTAASRAAMNAPVLELVADRSGGALTPDHIQIELRPDSRLDRLIRAGTDPADLDPPLHQDIGTLTEFFYERFRELLEEAGMPTLPMGIAWDQAWGRPPSVRGEPIDPLTDEDGIDRFWNLTLTDAERIVMPGERFLSVSHLCDLRRFEPPESRSMGWNDFVTGPEGGSNIMIVVRPWEQLVSQYRMRPADASLLAAAAVDGVVVAVRVESTTDTEGVLATDLAVLSSAAQIADLAALETDHGLVVNISTACCYSSRYLAYWRDALDEAGYVVHLVDFPRRRWLESQARNGQRLCAVPLALQVAGKVDVTVMGMAIVVRNGDDGEREDRFVVLGSRLMMTSLMEALLEIPNAHIEDDTSEFETTGIERFDLLASQLKRLVAEEPWFDARSPNYLGTEAYTWPSSPPHDFRLGP